MALLVLSVLLCGVDVATQQHPGAEPGDGLSQLMFILLILLVLAAVSGAPSSAEPCRGRPTTPSWQALVTSAAVWHMETPLLR